MPPVRRHAITWPNADLLLMASLAQYFSAIGIKIQYISRTKMHFMMFSASLVLCAGNSPVTSEFPSQRPMTWSFLVFFYLRLNKRLSKQSRRRWFEKPSRSLWRHCNGWPEKHFQMFLQIMASIDVWTFFKSTHHDTFVTFVAQSCKHL